MEKCKSKKLSQILIFHQSNDTILWGGTKKKKKTQVEEKELYFQFVLRNYKGAENKKSKIECKQVWLLPTTYKNSQEKRIK